MFATLETYTVLYTECTNTLNLRMKSFSLIIYVNASSHRGPPLTLIPSVLKREHLDWCGNDSALIWGHIQPDICSYLCMRAPPQYQLKLYHWPLRNTRGRDKRKKFTVVRQTDWPLHDPHMTDRIQMSRRGTCQVNSITICISAAQPPLCAVCRRISSQIFSVFKVELID